MDDLDKLFDSGADTGQLPPGVRVAPAMAGTSPARSPVEPSAFLCSPLGGFSRLCAALWVAVVVVCAMAVVDRAQGFAGGPFGQWVFGVCVSCTVVWTYRAAVNVGLFGVVRRRRSWWSRLVPPWSAMTFGALLLDLWRGAHPDAARNSRWAAAPVPLALWCWAVLAPLAVIWSVVVAGLSWPAWWASGVWVPVGLCATVAVERVRWRHHRRALSVGYGATGRPFR